MIFPNGYLPFRSAFDAWSDHVIRHEQLLDAEGVWKDDDSGLLFAQSAHSRFCNDIYRSIPIHLYQPSGVLCRISNQICDFNAVSDFECFRNFGLIYDYLAFASVKAEEFDIDLHDHLHDLANEFARVPKFGDYIFSFLNPQLSIVDCIGNKFASQLADLEFDLNRLTSLELTISGHEGPIFEAMSADDFRELSVLRVHG